MSNDSKTTDPRIAAGAKAWDKHMGGRYAPDEVEELSEEVAVILAAADAVDPRKPRKPRTITTVEELGALPHGAVVFNNNNESVSKYGDWWFFPGIKHRFAVAAVSLPVTVLREPEAEATR